MKSKRLARPNSSSINLDESSSRTSVKVMDPEEASLSALQLPPEVGINEVCESDKVSNSRSWQYLTIFILDVIKVPVGGDSRNNYPSASSFMKIHEAASGTQTPDRFRSKPQPNRRFHHRARQLSSMIWIFKWGCKCNYKLQANQISFSSANHQAS